MWLPAACPSPVLEPPPLGRKPQGCADCSVTWWSTRDETVCFVCGGEPTPDGYRVVNRMIMADRPDPSLPAYLLNAVRRS